MNTHSVPENVQKVLWERCMAVQGARYTPRDMFKGYNKKIFEKVCTSFGLSAEGSKEELFFRLVDHVQSNERMTLINNT